MTRHEQGTQTGATVTFSQKLFMLLSACRLSHLVPTRLLQTLCLGLGLLACTGSTDTASPSAAALQDCASLASDPAWPYPATIADAVARLNALPQPVSVSCFIASLPRPLAVVPVNSVLSAQPAAGRRSPRLFIYDERLILSIVPDGDGANLLEFGQFVDELNTIKGELEFPITATVSDEAPYTHVQQETGPTTCGFCHAREVSHPTIPEARVSVAYRPHATTLIPLTTVRIEHVTCDHELEPERCELLDAVFNYGSITEGTFPEALSTFN